MAFNGKLIELDTSGSYVEFPATYIKAEGYRVTPNQRMETSANRATSGVLVRKTASHTATKIDLETVPITNREVSEIYTLLSNAYTDSLQRKLNLRYYDPLSDDYLTGTFYIPDIDYDIMRIDIVNDIVHYNNIRIAFIEY